MEIAALRVKIMFQRQEAVADGIGNHTNRWADYFACRATVGGEGGTEKAVAGTVVEDAVFLLPCVSAGRRRRYPATGSVLCSGRNCTISSR